MRAAMLVALWLLVRSWRAHDRPDVLAAHVGLFYLVTLTIIASNALFGISFLSGIVVAMLVAWALSRTPAAALRSASPLAGRLFWVGIAVMCLGFLFIFYLYTPASQALQAFGTIPKKLAALFLTTTSESTANAYQAVSSGWVSLWLYFLVSSGTYLLLLGSTVVWIRQGWTWVRDRADAPDQQALLGWLLYTAFAVQGILAVIGDLTGQLGGNLQHRSFPSFAIVAAPLVVRAVAGWRPSVRVRRLLGTALAVLATLAILKATNEPSLSNKWTFASASELAALAWARDHQSYELVWVGPDERLATAADIEFGSNEHGVVWNIYTPSRPTRAFLVSDLIRLQYARSEHAMPPLDQANVLYDRGDVQLYRLRPDTPYQR